MKTWIIGVTIVAAAAVFLTWSPPESTPTSQTFSAPVTTGTTGF